MADDQQDLGGTYRFDEGSKAWVKDTPAKTPVSVAPSAPGEDVSGTYYLGDPAKGNWIKGDPQKPNVNPHAPENTETTAGHKAAITATSLPVGIANALAAPMNLMSAAYEKWLPPGTPIPASDIGNWGGITAPSPEHWPTLDARRDFSNENPNAGPLGVLPQTHNSTERILDRTGQAVGAAALGGGAAGGLRSAAELATLAAAPSSLVAAQDEWNPQFAQQHPYMHFAEEAGLPILMGTPQAAWHAFSPYSSENAARQAMGQITTKSAIPATELRTAAEAAKDSGITMSQGAGKAGIPNAGKLATLEDNVGVVPPAAGNEAATTLKKLPTPTNVSTASVDDLNSFASRMDQLATANDGLTRSALSKQLQSDWNDKGTKFQNAIIQKVLNVGDDKAFAERWSSLPPFMQRSIAAARPDVGARLADIASRTSAINPTRMPLEPMPPKVDWGDYAALGMSALMHDPAIYTAKKLTGPLNQFGKTSQSALDAEISRNLRDSNTFLNTDTWLRGRPNPMQRLGREGAAGTLGALGQGNQ